MSFLDYVGGRKFVICFVALVLVVFAVPVDAATKLGFITSIVGIYATVNTANKRSKE